MAYLTTLSVSQTLRYWKIGRLVNEELERTWKGAVVTCYWVPSWHLSGENVEKYEKPQSDLSVSQPGFEQSTS